MKQLDIAPLERLQGFLEQVDCGDVVIRAILQAYSLRLQGLDKKLSKSLEEDVMASSSPQDLGKESSGAALRIGVAPHPRVDDPRPQLGPIPITTSPSCALRISSDSRVYLW